MAEEQAAQYLAGLRPHGDRQVTANRQVPSWHAVMRRHAAVARIRGHIGDPDRRRTGKGWTKQRRRAWMAKLLEGFARGTRKRKQLVGRPVVGHHVVKKRAELGAADLRARIGDGLQDGMQFQARR